MTDDIVRLADCLAASGIGYVFGVTGSGPSYALIAALKARGVPYVPVSHEGVGPIAAGAYGVLTGRPAVAVSIKGPGMANMTAGMAAAALEGYAPICVAENYDDAVSTDRMHKRLDQHAMAGAVVDGIYSLLDLDELPAVLAHHARATRPLYIEMSKTASRHRPLDRHAATPAWSGDVRAAFDARLTDARHVVAMVGSLVKRRGWQALADALQIPVFTTAQAKGTIDERKPNAAGVYTGAGRALALETALLPLADLVVTIGLRNTEILGHGGKPGFLNIDLPHHLATSCDTLVGEADVRHVLAAMANKPAWGSGAIEDHRRKWRDYVDSFEWMPGQVFAALDALDWSHALVLDTGTFCTIGEHGWSARPRRDFLGSSNGRNLGIGVPHALGAACARPGLPVFCVLGDGGIRYYMAEIRTIAALHLPVCFILMKDGRYGSIACNVRGDAPDPDLLQPLGTSWCGVMQAMGLESGHAACAQDFEALLWRWDRRRPCYVEASFDPDTYLTVASEIRA
jgi:acetolactate synthase-1/2/3 large subunit